MRRRQVVADLVLTAVLVAFALVVTAFALDDVSDQDRVVDGWALAAVILAGGPVALWRRVPEVTLAAAVVAAAGYLVAGYPYGPILFPVALGAYAVARRRPLRESSRACLLALAVLLVHVLFNDAALPGWLALVPAAAWVLVPFAVGLSLRTADESAARERDALVRSHLEEERLRIAQEVHDVVGHGLAAVQMQADVALHVMDQDPDQARRALRSISRSSAAAFAELRSTLEVLRSDGAPLDPTPGLARVEDLVARVRQGGVEVDLRIEGSPTALPEQVDLVAYRVLQEALTNVLRHGAEPRAHARITYAEEHIEVIVRNPGPTRPDRVDGLGITGMRRRVAAIDGTLRAGATAEGFEVAAELPLRGPS